MKWTRLYSLLVIVVIWFLWVLQIENEILVNGGSMLTLTMIERQVFMSGVIVTMVVLNPVILSWMVLMVWDLRFRSKKQKPERKRMRFLLGLYKDEFGVLSLNMYEKYRRYCNGENNE